MAPLRQERFYGWRVVGAAFALAMFGLGIGFHGPAVYLQAVHAGRGWSLALVSAAVTVHFLVGAVVTANLPALYRRFGIARVTKGGAVVLALGIVGWAVAGSPALLFAAAVVSGAGWVTMGVAAINAMVSPWFVRARPQALALAYNGANLGGVVFLPLWATAIAQVGFPVAAVAIGAAMVVVVWGLADLVLVEAPDRLGLRPDGDGPTATVARPASAMPRRVLWRDVRFVTLAAGMALGLFAQIGLASHLYSLLVPALGPQPAGWALSLVTATAILGRSLIGWTLPEGADRRLIACASYGVQILGCGAFMLAGGQNAALLLTGVVLFGIGFGNGTWLPPLIAQAEFSEAEAARVVPLIIAMAQGAYAFAPAAFGLIREAGSAAATSHGDAAFFLAVSAFQAAAIAALSLAYARRQPVRE